PGDEGVDGALDGGQDVGEALVAPVVGVGDLVVVALAGVGVEGAEHPQLAAGGLDGGRQLGHVGVVGGVHREEEVLLGVPVGGEGPGAVTGRVVAGGGEGPGRAGVHAVALVPA